MAQKKGFLGSIFSKRKESCCDIRIEEIPEQNDHQDKEANDDGCCYTPKPSAGEAVEKHKEKNEGRCCCCNGPKRE